jgi:hypothetical protein
MPEHLRALIVIVALAGATFAFARPLACAGAMGAQAFVRRRNLWFAITLAAFLAHDFWVFIVFAAAILLYALPREPNKLALYYLVLFAVPPIEAQIAGFGLVQHLFSIHYLRLLSLLILLPAFLALRQRPDVELFGRLLADKLLLGYLALLFFLQLPHESLTETLRSRALYAFTDAFLPYYVASRSLRHAQGFRDALMAFALAGLMLSAIAFFEFARGWMLYFPLDEALGRPWGFQAYLGRGDHVRAYASSGQPIVLGYALAVALGFWLFLGQSVRNRRAWALGLLVLAAGLVATLSRGPWLGAAAIALIFILTGRHAIRRVVLLTLAVALATLLVLSLPGGQAILQYLPFVGTVDEFNVTYRQRLLEISLGVILENPMFGAYDFLQLPVMQQLRQGQGIIDIVNTYLWVGLESGLVGLGLFCAFFLCAGAGILRGMRSLGGRDGELHVLGRALFATLAGMLLIIASLSSIGAVPYLYWSVAGLGVAYARMLALARSAAPARAGVQPA